MTLEIATVTTKAMPQAVDKANRKNSKERQPRLEKAAKLILF